MSMGKVLHEKDISGWLCTYQRLKQVHVQWNKRWTKEAFLYVLFAVFHFWRYVEQA